MRGWDRNEREGPGDEKGHLLGERTQLRSGGDGPAGRGCGEGGDHREWPRPSSPREGPVVGWRVFAQGSALKLLSCPPTRALVPSPP